MFILKFYENEAGVEFERASEKERSENFFHLHLQRLLSRQTWCPNIFFPFRYIRGCLSVKMLVRAKYIKFSCYVHGTLLLRIFPEFYGEFRNSDNNNDSNIVWGKNIFHSLSRSLAPCAKRCWRFFSFPACKISFTPFNFSHTSYESPWTSTFKCSFTFPRQMFWPSITSITIFYFAFRKPSH